jgi:hypothetical protein
MPRGRHASRESLLFAVTSSARDEARHLQQLGCECVRAVSGSPVLATCFCHVATYCVHAGVAELTLHRWACLPLVSRGAGGDDGAASLEAREADVLAEIIRGRDGATHFRVVRTLGNGSYGYVFKVRCCVSVRVCACVVSSLCLCRYDVFTRDTRSRASTTR